MCTPWGPWTPRWTSNIPWTCPEGLSQVAWLIHVPRWPWPPWWRSAPWMPRISMWASNIYLGLSWKFSSGAMINNWDLSFCDIPFKGHHGEGAHRGDHGFLCEPQTSSWVFPESLAQVPWAIPKTKAIWTILATLTHIFIYENLVIIRILKIGTENVNYIFMNIWFSSCREEESYSTHLQDPDVRGDDRAESAAWYLTNNGWSVIRGLKWQRKAEHSVSQILNWHHIVNTKPVQNQPDSSSRQLWEG